MHKDQLYIQYLQHNNSQGIQLIYKQYAKRIVTLIKQNSGTEDDAYDVFQDSLVDIYHMASTGNFILTTSFGSFLTLVCKRKWLNVLKKNKKMPVTNNEENLLNIEDLSSQALEAMLLKIEKENKVFEILRTMGQRCQDIILGCLVEKKQEEIAASLGITYAYLRKKKSECMASLIAKVKSLGIF